MTVAIMLQFCIESALHATSPAELAIKKMEQAVQAVRTGFRGFFEGDLDLMAEGMKTEGYLLEARALAAEADPSVQLAPGWQAHGLDFMSGTCPPRKWMWAEEPLTKSLTERMLARLRFHTSGRWQNAICK